MREDLASVVAEAKLSQDSRMLSPSSGGRVDSVGAGFLSVEKTLVALWTMNSSLNRRFSKNVLAMLQSLYLYIEESVGVESYGLETNGAS